MQAHPEAPSKSEFEQLKEIAGGLMSELRETYGDKFKPKPRDNYAWAGPGGFRQIEDSVFKESDWSPRAEYIFASERVHSAPNAGEPRPAGGSHRIFLIGPNKQGTDCARGLHITLNSMGDRSLISECFVHR